jgi:surface protein
MSGYVLSLTLKGIIAGNTVSLPLKNPNNVVINWGEVITSDNTISYTYTQNHTNIKIKIISGTFTQFGNEDFLWSGSKKVREVDIQYLQNTTTSLSGAFCTCTILTNIVGNLPGFITNCSYMFFNATLYNQNISDWDVSNVTDMNSMFYEAFTFNNGGSSSMDWDVSNVTNMDHMFTLAPFFNVNIGTWNVSNVNNMAYMFADARIFNKNLELWNIENVTDMTEMFDNSGMDILNFSNTLEGWAQPTQGKKMDVTVGVKGMIVDNEGYNASQTLVTDFSWNFVPPLVPLITLMTLSFQNISSQFVMRLPLIDVSNVFIDWGDGTIDNNTQHVYQRSFTDLSVNITGHDSPSYTFSQFGNGAFYDWNNTNIENIDYNINLNGAYYLNSVYWSNDLSNSLVNSFAGAFVNAQKLTSVTGTLPNTVTNIQYMFQNAYIFNSDISGWDVSNVVDMDSTFYNNYVFNQDLSAWNVSNVTNMSSMFYYATDFQNGGISGYLFTTYPPTSNLLDTNAMFENTHQFNSDVSNWDVTQVTNMKNMFCNSYVFNQSLNTWDISNVTDMSHMFEGASVFANGNAPGYMFLVPPTQKLQDTNTMFKNCYSFNSNISNWDTSHVTDMSNMFRNAGVFNQNLSNWDVLRVTNLSRMFQNELSGNYAFNNGGHVGYMFNSGTSNVLINTSYMFGNTYINTSIFNQGVSNWDVSNVTDMSYMFNYAINFTNNGFTGNLFAVPPSFSQLKNTSYMFQFISYLHFEISDWDVSSVTDMSSMFSACSSFNSDLSSWDVSSVLDMNNMFNYATSFNQDISSWNVSRVTNMSRMLFHATQFNQDLSYWDVSRVKTMAYMFDDCGMNTTNFSFTLIGWSQLPELQKIVIVGDAGMSVNADGYRASRLLYLNYTWLFVPPLTNPPLNTILTLSMSNVPNGFTVELPLQDAIDVMIDWGDGYTTNMTTHTYNRNFQTVEINILLGTLFSQFGKGPYVKWNGVNYVTSVVMNPNLVTSGITRFSGAFFNATQMKKIIGPLPSSVTNCSGMFLNARLFDSKLSYWNVTNVTDMRHMFDYCGLSQDNFSKTLIGWSKQNVRRGVVIGDKTLKVNGYGFQAFLVLKTKYSWIFVPEPVNPIPPVPPVPPARFNPQCCPREVNKKSIDDDTYPNISNSVRQTIMIETNLGGKTFYGNYIVVDNNKKLQPVATSPLFTERSLATPLRNRLR